MKFTEIQGENLQQSLKTALNTPTNCPLHKTGVKVRVTLTWCHHTTQRYYRYVRYSEETKLPIR